GAALEVLAHAQPGAERRTADGHERGLREPRRPPALGAAGALLPDARLGPRRRRLGAGDDAAGLAGLRPVRRQRASLRTWLRASSRTRSRGPPTMTTGSWPKASGAPTSTSP